MIVPVLFYLFTSLGYSETAMHVAVTTSLATIIATSIRSVMAHNKRGAVDWSVLRGWAPWIVLGALMGMAAAAFISGRGMTIIFGSIALLLALQIFFGRPDWKLADDLPRGLLRWTIGGSLGALSALMGIGGGAMGVTLMTVYGRPIHQSVGTAAGFGVAIGLPAAMAGVLIGWSRAGLPPAIARLCQSDCLFHNCHNDRPHGASRCKAGARIGWKSVEAIVWDNAGACCAEHASPNNIWISLLPDDQAVLFEFVGIKFAEEAHAKQGLVKPLAQDHGFDILDLNLTDTD